MHARNRNLAIAGISYASELAQHLTQRPAATGAAGRRDDAVRARFVAAGLNAERESRAACEPRRDLGAAGAFTAAKPLCRRQPELGYKMILAGVRNDLNDTGQ